MKRRTFLRGVLAGPALLASACQANLSGPSLALSHTSGMNVLCINIDDMPANVLGCYGHTIVQTPHMDRFSRTAMRFARCYCQVPIGYPSRSSFLTGLRPETTGIYDDTDPLDQRLPAETRSLPELLGQYGIYTVNIGNVFGTPGRATRRLDAFDRLEFSPLPEEYTGESRGLPPELQDEPESHESEKQKARLTAHVLEQLARQKRQFFLSLDFTAPWEPSRCPDEYRRRYDPDTIPLPQARPEEDASVPTVGKRFGRDDRALNGSYEGARTDEDVRQAIRSYYGCVSFIDAQIGVVLEALEHAGLSNETIVIIFGANGIQLGEHGLWSNSTLFEQCTRVPLLIRVPGVTTKGTACDEIVELVDLLPTLCELLVIPPPDRLEGTSLAPLLADPRQPWKLAAFTVCSTDRYIGCSVRTKRWRYTDWQVRETSLREFELYDLDSDPWEQTNVARDDGCRNQRTILANLLQRGWQVAHQRRGPSPGTPANPASYRAGRILW
ncbi:MAG: sulfatase [Phycisphaerales bacterium]|nr:MAG: sulfatase [Phycisphaerales bacterium]